MNSTGIEWTDRTWNPVTGCTPISEGCQNCYAKRMAKRLRGRCGYPKDNPFRVTLRPKRLTEPLKDKTPQKVFVGSMSDLFHDDVPNDFIDQIFAVMGLSYVMRETPHTFEILTKRAERMKSYLSDPETEWRVTWAMKRFGHNLIGENSPPTWPLPNVWLGVTAENQASADERIPLLLKIPAAKYFVSLEPLLGPIDLGLKFNEKLDLPHSWFRYKHHPGIHWVILGGETGPGARPMDEEWARSLRDQCRVADVPFFMKQMARKAPIPHDLMIREFPR